MNDDDDKNDNIKNAEQCFTSNCVDYRGLQT